MGTKMESKYEGGLEEESGWTSYLETDLSSASLFSESSTYSNCRRKTLNAKKGKDVYGLARIRTCNGDDAVNIEEEEEEVEEEVGIKGILREAADFPNEESSESSNGHNSDGVRASSSIRTLSDASCFSSSSPPCTIPKRSFKRFNYPKLHQIGHPKLLKESSQYRLYQRKTISSKYAAAANDLEDTATSSPSSALGSILNKTGGEMHATEDCASSCSSSTTTFHKGTVDERQQHVFYEDGNDDVSTRFKALEALIPRLKEVAGKGKEEEMVKVIERHVRDLELQVELLSSAWQLSQLKHQ